MVVTDCPETPFVYEFQPDAKGKTVPGLPVLVLGYYSEATSCGHYVALVEEDGVDADSQDVLKTIEKDLFVLLTWPQRGKSPENLPRPNLHCSI